ncbi:hypothetical protein PQQ52_17820 [Paraburkholderia sediminicola]|uniref:helix-turn-helix transcriptional regulator n=1 Tax=Paraburkholderia sediminicola TaxID=458836 RepID=UPI0038B785C2
MASKPTTKADSDQSSSPTLPQTGFVRKHEVLALVPYGAETLRKLIRAGKAPQPVYFSRRSVGFRVEDVREYLRDPLNYIAPTITTVPAERRAA